MSCLDVATRLRHVRELQCQRSTESEGDGNSLCFSARNQISPVQFTVHLRSSCADQSHCSARAQLPTVVFRGFHTCQLQLRCTLAAVTSVHDGIGRFFWAQANTLGARAVVIKSHHGSGACCLVNQEC